MTRPSVDNRISLGNILTIIGFVVSFAFGYATITAGVKQNTAAVIEVTETVKSIEIRVRSNELRGEGQGRTVDAIIQNLDDIKQQQRENNALLRQLLQQSTR